MSKTILIHLKSGNIEDVENLPENYNYRVLDWDSDEPLHPNTALYFIHWIVGQQNTNALTVTRIMEVLNRVHLSYLS